MIKFRSIEELEILQLKGTYSNDERVEDIWIEYVIDLAERAKKSRSENRIISCILNSIYENKGAV